MSSRLFFTLFAGLCFVVGCTPELDEGRNAGDCVDGADNDGDGFFDCNDPGCSESPDCEAGGDDDVVVDDDDANPDDDDAKPDDDDSAPDDDDDAGGSNNVLIELSDDPSLGATTPNGTSVFVFVMNPKQVTDGFPFGEPGDRVDGTWQDGFSGEAQIPVGSTVGLIAMLDVNGDEEVCSEGDHHGFAEVTATEEVQTVEIAIVNVLDGTECEREGKPE